MKLSSSLVTLVATAGCTLTPAPPIPSAAPHDGAGATAIPLVHQDVRPCGYTLAYDLVDFDQSRTHTDWTATITYDAANRDVAERAVDATGAVVMHDETDYDAAGRFVTFTNAQVDAPSTTYRAVYDPAGRLVRYAGADTASGVEDWIATYGYDDDHRVRAHLILPTTTYDRAYRYDEGRLVEVDKDVGPDGAIDQITTYAYDDAARVETRTTTDATGQIVGAGTTRYDDDDRVLTVEDTVTTGGATARTTDVHAYDHGRETSDTFGTTYIRSADHAVSSTSNQIVWRYDHCPGR